MAENVLFCHRVVTERNYFSRPVNLSHYNAVQHAQPPSKQKRKKQNKEE
jgi:hypothetical protein